MCLSFSSFNDRDSSATTFVWSMLLLLNQPDPCMEHQLESSSNPRVECLCLQFNSQAWPPDLIDPPPTEKRNVKNHPRP